MATFKERLPQLQKQYQGMEDQFSRYCDEKWNEWLVEFQSDNGLTDKQMEKVEESS